MTKEAETEQESSSGRNVVKVQLNYLGQVTESKDGNSIEEMFPKLTPGCNLKIQPSKGVSYLEAAQRAVAPKQPIAVTVMPLPATPPDSEECSPFSKNPGVLTSKPTINKISSAHFTSVKDIEEESEKKKVDYEKGLSRETPGETTDDQKSVTTLLADDETEEGRKKEIVGLVESEFESEIVCNPPCEQAVDDIKPIQPGTEQNTTTNYPPGTSHLFPMRKLYNGAKFQALLNTVSNHWPLQILHDELRKGQKLFYDRPTDTFHPVDPIQYRPAGIRHVRAFHVRPDNSSGAEVRPLKWDNLHYSFVIRKVDGIWRKKLTLQEKFKPKRLRRNEPFPSVIPPLVPSESSNTQNIPAGPTKLPSKKKKKVTENKVVQSPSVKKDFFDDDSQWFAALLTLYTKYDLLNIPSWSCRADWNVREIPAENLLRVLLDEPIEPVKKNWDFVSPFSVPKTKSPKKEEGSVVNGYQLFPSPCGCTIPKPPNGFEFYIPPACPHHASFIDKPSSPPIPPVPSLPLPPPTTAEKPKPFKISHWKPVPTNKTPCPPPSSLPNLNTSQPSLHRYPEIYNLPRPEFLFPQNRIHQGSPSLFVGNIQTESVKMTFFGQQPTLPSSYLSRALNPVTLKALDLKQFRLSGWLAQSPVQLMTELEKKWVGPWLRPMERLEVRIPPNTLGNCYAAHGILTLRRN